MSQYSMESLDLGVMVVLTGATLPDGWRSEELTWLTAHGPGQSVAWDEAKFDRLVVGHASVARKLGAMMRCHGLREVARIESLVEWDVESWYSDPPRLFDVWAKPVCEREVAHV